MSAIAGVVHLDGSPVDPEPVRQMMVRQRAHGPDALEVWSEGPACLGNALFRATAESRMETQPCTLDGKVWISADVFLTGRRDLVDALRSAGREVALDRPDPELVLHAYHAWGDGMLDRLLGDFAFVLWDGRKNRLLAARDHFGNRALFYAACASVLVLSGGVEAVARHPAIAADYSEFHVTSFLALGSATLLDRSGTAYHGVRKLRPAECLVAERGSFTVRRYWECPAEVPLFRYRSEEEVLERFRQLFAQAVEDRLRTSRLVLSVSGGMDSTSVAAMVASVIRKRGFGPECIALCMDHQRVNPTDEARLAGLLCGNLGIPLERMEMDRIPWLTPDFRPVTLAVYPMMNQQQEFVRRLAGLAPAAMFGASGDQQRTAKLREALSGGNPCQAAAGFFTAWRYLGHRPELHFGLGSLGKRLLRRRGHYDAYLPEWLNSDLVRTPEWLEAYEAQRMGRLPAMNPKNRRNPILQVWATYKDSGTVFHGNCPDRAVEGLDPLGDKRIFDFLLSLPQMPWFSDKYLMRRTMRSDLPPEIWRRPRTWIPSHHVPFFADPRNRWLDAWKQELKELPFVNLKRIPDVVAAGVPPHQGFAHIKPWVWHRWRQGDCALE